MLAEVHVDQRVELAGRHGIVSRIDPAPRRGLPGRVEDEVWVRWDDGPEEPVNPGDLNREGEEIREWA